METLQSKQPEENEEINEEHSLKSAMYTSLLFVGGGIVLFWLLLFIIYTVRA